MVFTLKRGPAPKDPPGTKPSDSMNFDSEVSPQDTDRQIPDQGETAEAKVKLVMDRYRSACDDVRPIQGSWFESLAFYLGNQWVQWNDSAGRLRPMRDPRRPHKVYDKRNKIRPKIGTLRARALRAKPTVSVAPLTDSKLDRAATSEARAVLADMDARVKRQQQAKRAVQFALTTSTVFLKITWDPSAEAEIPTMGKGEISGSKLAKVGNIIEDIAPCFEVYIDPKARVWEDAGWIIHEKIRSVEYVKSKYGEGINVVGDVNAGPSGYVESRLASVVGEYSRGNEPGQASKSVSVKEMWEKPTLRYPEGRLMTVAGDRLVRDDPWPYAKKDGFPFVPLSFEEGQSTIWGLNAVSDLISPQRAYNEKVSRGLEWMRTSWGKLLVQEGSEIGATAFDAAAPNEVITYARGANPPVHLPAAPFPGAILNLLAVDEKDMNDSSGVHEVSNGTAPTGVTAASAIQQLLESDTTQMADFIQNIETWHQRRAEWEIALAAQFYKEDRLLGVSQATEIDLGPKPKQPQAGQQVGPQPGQPQGMVPVAMGQSPDGSPSGGGGGGLPQQAPQEAEDDRDDWLSPRTQVHSFKALAAGGTCRVIVSPASALAISPVAKQQAIREDYKEGLFGPPGSPPAINAALKLMSYADADVITESIIRYQAEERAHALAMQPNPAQVAAVQAQAKQQAQMADQEHIAQMQALEDHKLQTQAQIDQAADAQSAQEKMQHDAQITALDHAENERERQWQERMKLMDAHLAIMGEHAKRLMPPGINPISVSADPAATVQIEALQGVQGAIPRAPTPAAPHPKTSPPEGGA